MKTRIAVPALAVIALLALGGCSSSDDSDDGGTTDGGTTDGGTGTDTVAPTWDSSTITVTNETATSMDVSWSAATDDVAVTEYVLTYDDGSGPQTEVVATTSTTLMGLTPLTTYSLGVEARDEAGNESTGGPSGSGSTIAVLDNSIPQYLLADCGSIAVQNTAFSTNMAAPATLAVDTIVQGRIDPDSATNTMHYWNIDLAPGFYHVLLESTRVDNRNSNLGLRLSDLAGNNIEQGNIIRGNAIDFKARTYNFLEVETAGTLSLSIEPGFSAEDYHLGIFMNGSSVPSPYFTDCPVINTLAIGVAETIELTGDDDASGREVWYALTPNPTDYTATVDATRVDGQSSNIIYRVRAYDQFGQEEREERIIFGNDVGVTSTNTGPFNVSEAVNYWIRVSNSNTPPLSLEFTLN